MYRLIDYGAMLRERRRIDAYARALAEVITPTSIVLDAGAGLGTFSIIAARLGAARVYAVEIADIITVAEETANANGVADRIRFIQSSAREVEIDERVDVIVSDLAGALPLFEERIPSIISLRDRCLKEGGVLIPQRDRLMCAPVSSAEIYARVVDPWNVADIDFTAAKTMALNTPHAMRVEPRDLAAEPRCWADLDYATIDSPDVSASLEWTIDKTIHGIALWFESTLHGEITYSSGPSFPDGLHSTLVLPLLEPIEGQTLNLSIDATLAGGRYFATWHASTERHRGTRQSTLLSEPSFVVTHQASGESYALNETGALIWGALERGEDVKTIAAEIAERFDVDPERAAEDVAAFARSIDALR